MKNTLFDNFHIIYIITSLFLTVLILFLLNNFIKKREHKNIILIILGALTFFIHISELWVFFLSKKEAIVADNILFPIYFCNLSMILLLITSLIRNKSDQVKLLELIDSNGSETAENKAFTENLFKLINALSDRVEEYNEFYIKYIDISTRYDFVGDKEFEVVKPYNMILMIVVLGMIGGIAGVTTALIKENINDKKELVNETK